MSRLPPPLPRNPHTRALHRRDVAWQIRLPVILLVIVGLSITALSIFGATPAGRSAGADVSLIFLIVIAAALALVPLALLVGMIFGLWYVLRYLPGYAKIAQDYAALAAAYARRASERATAPLIAVESAAAAARSAIGRGDENVKRKA